MDERDRELYRERYAARLERYGHDPRSLGWTKGRQRHRFEALLRHVRWSRDCSVLDVGCGFGDLGAFLRERGHRGEYVGIDLVDDLVRVGRARYPDLDLRVADLEEFTADTHYDLVLATGVFNARLEHGNNLDHIGSSLRSMFRLARIAVVADFLTADVDRVDDALFYTPIGDVVECVYRLTRRFVIDHQTMPYEYTITLFADDRVDERTLFQAVEETVD